MSPKKNASFHPTFEQLENREMLSVDQQLFANIASDLNHPFNVVELATPAEMASHPEIKQALGYVGSNRGIDADPTSGLIYSGRRDLFEIDPVAGSLQKIGRIQTADDQSVTIGSLSFSPEGVLYGLDSDNHTLYQIDQTGQANLIATLQEDSISDKVYGIEFDSDGTLYGAGFSLMTFDPETGRIVNRVGRLEHM